MLELVLGCAASGAGKNLEISQVPAHCLLDRPRQSDLDRGICWVDFLAPGGDCPAFIVWLPVLKSCPSSGSEILYEIKRWAGRDQGDASFIQFQFFLGFFFFFFAVIRHSSFFNGCGVH